ncbi:MAG: hypothetical protein EDM05_55970 (plasmid) [Leptolyngbya sp. IPPAS B-1204]
MTPAQAFQPLLVPPVDEYNQTLCSLCKHPPANWIRIHPRSYMHVVVIRGKARMLAVAGSCRQRGWRLEIALVETAPDGRRSLKCRLRAVYV